MAHDITHIIIGMTCLIDLATGQLKQNLIELRGLCEDLNTFILESSEEQENAHNLLNEIDTWANNRCGASNISGNINGEVQGFKNQIHQFI